MRVLVFFEVAFIVLAVINIYCLVDAAVRKRDEFKSPNGKQLWITLLAASFIVPIGLLITPVAYLVAAKKRPPAEAEPY